MRKPPNLIKTGKHRPAAVHEEVFKLKDRHKIFLLRRNISQLRILVYNTSHNHRKYCKKKTTTTKKSYSKISKLMITLRLRERLGRCWGKLNHGDCSGTLSLLLSVSTGCGRDWVKAPSFKQFHGAAINIEPTQSQVYSQVSTNGHLSTTANSL